jgi:FkbM family methyltransferase
MVFNFLMLLEKFFSILQGKGYGAVSIKTEVNQSFSKLTHKPNLAIDIGGNVGKYSEALRRKSSELEIHIFEPSKVNFIKLENLFMDDALISINNYGLSNHKNDSILYSDKAGSGLGSLTKRRLEHFGINFNVTEPVKLIRFEDYWINELNKRPIDLVKIDIEGHELDALKGFGAALANTKSIQFEFGGCNVDTRTYFRDFWYFFTENKFQVYRITPIGLQSIYKYSELDECFRTTNYLAINEN